MELSAKKKKYIRRNYPDRSVDELASELNLPVRAVKAVLALDGSPARGDARPGKTAQIAASAICWLLAATLLMGPFVFVRDIYAFNRLPQMVFIQGAAFLLLCLWLIRIGATRSLELPRTTLSMPSSAKGNDRRLICLLWATNVFARP